MLLNSILFARNHRLIRIMMLRHSTSRKQRVKILWMKRAIQTCFILAFSIWVVNQLKLLLANGNAKSDLTSEFFMDMRKAVPHQHLKITRKALRTETSVVRAKNVRDRVKAEGEDSRDNKEAEEGNDEGAEEWMEELNNQILEKADTVNDTSNGIQRAEDVEDGWDLPLVNGSDNSESFDSSVFSFDQDEKEYNLDLEVLEETTRIEEVSQEDAEDQ